MSACVHTPKYPDLTSIPTQQDAISRCSVVEGDERVAKQRALTSADGQSTRIDSAYWQGLNDAQRAAVVAHERAHPCIGMEVDCEGCADKVGGYFMRSWGYAPHVVRSAFSSLRVQRRSEHGEISANAHEGARYAERALAGRGLLGKTSTQISTSLFSIRQQATAPTAAATAPTAAATTVQRPALPGIDLTSPIRPAPGSGTVDPGGPGSSQLTPAPTEAQAGPPSVDTTTDALTQASGVAGDIVVSVLGEGARPHAVKVLIGAGVAAMLAVGLVFFVRRSK